MNISEERMNNLLNFERQESQNIGEMIVGDVVQTLS